MFMKATVLPVVLLIFVCHAQEQQVQECLVRASECSGSCLNGSLNLTLNEYAQNSIPFCRSTSIMIALPAGEHILDHDLSAENISDFSLVATGIAIINCQNVSLNFRFIERLVLTNIKFVSCGSNDSHGLTFSNVKAVHIVNITITHSTFGALSIVKSDVVNAIDVTISHHINSRSTLLVLKNLTLVTFSGTTKISNNSLENEAPSMIAHIENCTMTAENMVSSDNVSPFGVVVINSTISGTGEWNFSQNRISKGGGSLSLTNNTEAQFHGTIIFFKNYAENFQETTGGMLLRHSCLNLTGTLQSIANQGHTTSIQAIQSHITINGNLTINNNCNGFVGLSLAGRTVLTVHGSLKVHKNTLLMGAPLQPEGGFGPGGTVGIEDSQLTVVGEVSFLNNTLSPITAYNGKINLMSHNFTIVFENNAGVLFAVRSSIEIKGSSRFTANDKEDDFKDGTLAIQESTLELGGMYTFNKNMLYDENGGAIYATIKSLVKFSGHGIFSHNSANYGGAIYLDQLSRIEMENETKLLFEYNKAVKGGAIFIGTSIRNVNCSSPLRNCLFDEVNNHDVAVIFKHNKAYPGASVLHVNFDDAPPILMDYQALRNLESTFKILSNNSLPQKFSDSYRFDLCNCTNKCCDLNATRGKEFYLGARAFKFYGDKNMSEPIRGNLYSSLRSFDTNSEVISYVMIGNGELQRVSSQDCSEIKLTVMSPEDEETILLTIGESFLDKQKTIQVKVSLNTPCPRGFPLNINRTSCECDENIMKYLKSCDINEMDGYLKLKEFQSYWIAPYELNNSMYESSLSFYRNCPHGYCITDGPFKFEEDSICDNNRSGLLCGECTEDYSLLIGGEKCGYCSNNSSVALIVLFAALGIILIAFIFFTQMTVATGTINGLIFYVNIVNANRNVFFPESFSPGLSVFISWLNLDFGFEMCFYHRMNQSIYTGLQFLFPLYLWLISAVIIIVCHFSVRISTFFGKSDPVAVLATIILLSYNSLVHTIIRILSVVTLNTPDDSGLHVWLYNGNIVYGTENHVILIVIAIVFLVCFFLPYTLVLTSSQLLQRTRCASKMFQYLSLQPFIHVYQVPFKASHRYWVGLCFLMRCVLLIIFATVESIHANLFALITLCLISLSMFRVTGGIYNETWIDLLEISFILNLGILATSTWYAISKKEKQEIATYISVSVALLSFVVLVFMHVFWRLRKLPKFRKKMEYMMNKTKDSGLESPEKNPQKKEAGTERPTNTLVELKESCQVVDLREPLLESVIQ